MTFPSLLNLCPLKSPLGLGQICLGSYNSQINPHLPAKFGCRPTVVLKGGGGGNRHTHKGTMQLYK